MADLIIRTPAPEDHLWHILRDDLEPLILAFDAHTKDQDSGLDQKDTAAVVYVLKYLRLALALDATSSMLLADSGPCAAQDEDYPTQPPSTR